VARPIEELLADESANTVETLTIDQLRSLREEHQQLEVALSYVRRLTQGRLDILVADLRRRADGGRLDVQAVLDQLNDILSEGLRGADQGRLPSLMVPEVTAELEAELEAAVPTTTLADLVHLTDAEALRCGEALRDLEKRVSIQRRALHDRIDVFERDLVRRYKANEVDVDSLLK
jgi:hypothetical protein